MTDLPQQIADLEAELDHLRDRAEQCRKSMIVAKVAMAAGTLLFAAILFGFIRSDSVLLVVAIAAVLAGTAFFGSSRGTLEQLAEKIRTCENRRTEMIDGMDLRTI
jgi:cell division septum initiation protein DivIVA